MRPVTVSTVERRRVKFIRRTDPCRALPRLAAGRWEIFQHQQVNVISNGQSRAADLHPQAASMMAASRPNRRDLSLVMR
jgi:hypothetical protein